jgi:hypothetical protein
MENDSSVAMAKSDAIWAILSQNRSRVITRSGLMGFTHRLMYVGEKPQFIVDSLGYEGIYDDYAILDRYYDSDNYQLAVLVGPKADSATYDSGKQEYEDFGDWVRDLPHDDANLYALGSSPNYYYLSSCWRTAVENALTELSRQISTNIKSLYKYDGYEIYKTVVEEGEVVLTNWRIVARYYEPSNRTYHVLVKMPVY